MSDTTCNPSTLQWTSLTNPSSDALEQRRGDEEIDVESESSNSFSIQVRGFRDCVEGSDELESRDAFSPALDDCVLHMGVQMRTGVHPFERTVYVDIVPKRTIVNRLGFSLQVCQEHNEQILGQISDGYSMSTLGIFRAYPELNDKTLTCSDKPVASISEHKKKERIRLRLLNNQGEPMTELSQPFAVDYKRYSFPLRLLNAGICHDPTQVMHVLRLCLLCMMNAPPKKIYVFVVWL